MVIGAIDAHSNKSPGRTCDLRDCNAIGVFPHFASGRITWFGVDNLEADSSKRHVFLEYWALDDGEGSMEITPVILQPGVPVVWVPAAFPMQVTKGYFHWETRHGSDSVWRPQESSVVHATPGKVFFYVCIQWLKGDHYQTEHHDIAP
jgi:hypothetical protein